MKIRKTFIAIMIPFFFFSACKKAENEEKTINASQKESISVTKKVEKSDIVSDNVSTNIEKPIKIEKPLPLTSNIIAYVNGKPVNVIEFNKVFANRSLEKLPTYLRREYDKNRKNFIKQLINNKLFEAAAAEETFTDNKNFQEELEKAVNQIKMKYYYEENITSKIKISDGELKKYYKSHPEKYTVPERVRARHILISLRKNPLPANITNAYNKIKKLRQRVLEGESFAEIAAAESDCPSRAKGGDLGFFERGQMVPEIEKAAFGLKKGEISDIIKSEFGYHILQVTDRLPQRVLPFEEVKDKIRNDLYSQREKKLYGDLLNKLTKKYKVIKNEKVIKQLTGTF